jgi:hypothetical protein
MSIESGRATFANYNDLFVRSQNKTPWRVNQLKASIQPTTSPPPEDPRSTKRLIQTSPSPTKSPATASKPKPKEIPQDNTPAVQNSIMMDHPVIKRMQERMDELQVCQVDILTYISESKELQHVVQSQVLEVSSRVSQMETTLGGVVSDIQTTTLHITQLGNAFQNLMTKQETAQMYIKQKETNDEIKGMLGRLLSSTSFNQSSSTAMVTSNTISTNKHKDVDLLTDLIDDYLENHPDDDNELMITSSTDNHLKQDISDHTVDESMVEDESIAESKTNTKGQSGKDDHNNSPGSISTQKILK